jgi:hypothetical protein
MAQPSTSTAGTGYSPNIRPTSLASSEDKDSIEDVTGDANLIKRVNACYEKANRAQQSAFSLFRDLYRLWRFYKAKNSSVKVFNPIAFALTQGLLSKVFVRPPKVVVTARGGGGFDLEAKIVSALLDYQFDNPEADFPMDEQFVSFLTELFICGTSVAKVCWETEFVTKFEQTPKLDKKGEPVLDKDGNPEYTRKKVNKKGFDDAVFEHIPIENFYIDPAAISVEDAAWVIYEKWVDKDYLLDRQEQGVFTGVDDLIAASMATGDKSGIEQARQAKGVTNTNEKYKNKFHLLEYWEDDKVVVVIDDQAVVRNEDNPYDHGRKPFVAMPYVRVPHEFYGVGALEPVQDLQKAINVTLTQRLEFVSNTLNQQFSVLTGRNVDEDAIIEGYPIVHMDSPDAVQALNKGVVPQSSFINNQELVGDMERTMGVSGYDVGSPASANDKTKGTKGGIEAIIGEAQSRFNFTLRRFEQIVLKKTAQLFLDLDMQYLPQTEEKLVMIMQHNKAQAWPVTKDVLKASEWHVMIVPGSTGEIDQAKKLNSFMQWAAFAAQSLGPGFDNEAAVIEAANLQEIDRPERFLKQAPPPEPPPEVPSMSMNFKDLPIEGQIEMAKKVGISLEPVHMMAQQAQQVHQVSQEAAAQAAAGAQFSQQGQPGMTPPPNMPMQ